MIVVFLIATAAAAYCGYVVGYMKAETKSDWLEWYHKGVELGNMQGWNNAKAGRPFPNGEVREPAK